MADAKKVKGKQRDDDFSSSDSEGEQPAPPASSSTAGPAAADASSKIYRLLGREKPIHHVLGGGAPADAFLWRNKKVSGAVVGVVTAIWILFELLEYHLLTVICHGLILALVVLFLYSNASTFINKTPPRLPEVYVPEDIAVGVALAIRREINKGFFLLRERALGRDLQKFLAVIAGLWATSFIGGSFNFLTLFYIAIVLLFTVPFVYEKYEDKVDAFSQKATVEIKKQYAVFDKKVLSKIPRGPLKDKRL